MTGPGEILIVEDDEAIAAGLELNLRLEGYLPAVANDAETAARVLAERTVALVLLDISLPKKTGLDLLRDLRASGDLTPVIVLSARQEEYDKVAALRLGADDYVTKPFALAELTARVQAVLRRYRAAGGEPSARVSFGEVEVNLLERHVKRRGAEVRLTPLEFDLLAFFVRSPSRVFRREELMREVWGIRSGNRRTVDNFVLQLRSKLEIDPDNPRHFVTVRGAGYRFDVA